LRPYISQLEGDLKSPTVATLFRICDALEVRAADPVERADAARKRKQGGCDPGLEPGDGDDKPHSPRSRANSVNRVSRRANRP
jgi:hypothetical protein